MWWDDGSGWWFTMPLLMLAFWVAVIWVVASLVRGRAVSAPDVRSRPMSAEEILAHRYARGEIDNDEYRRRLDMLRGGHVGGTPR